MAQQGRGFAALLEDSGSAPGTQVMYFIPTVAPTPEDLSPLLASMHSLACTHTHTHTNLKLELKVKTRFMYKTKQFSEKDWKPVPPGHHVSIVQCLRKACVPIQKRQVLYSYPTEVMSLLAQSFGPHTYLNSLTPSHSIFHSNFFSLRQSPYALLANLIT